MDITKKTRLEEAGIDVEDALNRFMNNENLMMKFLLRFPQDKNFPQLKAALDAGDAEAGYKAAHTLKGVVGNLSMTRLYAVTCTVSDALRSGDLATAANNLPELETAYQQVMKVLEEVG